MRTLPFPWLWWDRSVFVQRFGHGAQVGQEPAQDLRAADGHAWAKRTIKIEIHGLYGASAGCDEADKDGCTDYPVRTFVAILSEVESREGER
jgi:hypothetical protein